MGRRQNFSQFLMCFSFALVSQQVQLWQVLSHVRLFLTRAYFLRPTSLVSWCSSRCLSWWSSPNKPIWFYFSSLIYSEVCMVVVWVWFEWATVEPPEGVLSHNVPGKVGMESVHLAPHTSDVQPSWHPVLPNRLSCLIPQNLALLWLCCQSQNCFALGCEARTW